MCTLKSHSQAVFIINHNNRKWMVRINTCMFLMTEAYSLLALRRVRPTSPCAYEAGPAAVVDHFIFSSPTRQPTLRDVDTNNGIHQSPSHSQQHLAQGTNMAEERIQQLTALAEKQQKQMDDALHYYYIHWVLPFGECIPSFNQISGKCQSYARFSLLGW